jgi:hypothetical protein
MPFYIRRAFSKGPLRFNLSKSGLGVSVGVKGLRLGTGPKGPYVHAGRHGVYYRKNLGAPGKAQQSTFTAASPKNDQASSDFWERCIDSSFVIALNSRGNVSTAPFKWAAMTALVAFAAIATIDVAVAAFTGVILGSFVGIALSKVIRGEASVCLTLDRGTADERRYRYLDVLFDKIKETQSVWALLGHNKVRSAYGGPESETDRVIVRAERTRIPGVEMEFDVWAIRVRRLTYFFLPDCLLVEFTGRYQAYAYGDITIDLRTVNWYGEPNELVPADSKLLGHRWLYERKDGGPDRRYSDNEFVPVYECGELAIRTGQAPLLELHFSNRLHAVQFRNLFNNQLRSIGTPSETEWFKPPSIPASPLPSDSLRFFDLTSSASAADLSRRYRELAAQNHPDKVASLAPEFRILAEEKMKEINAHYERARRHIAG